MTTVRVSLLLYSLLVTCTYASPINTRPRYLGSIHRRSSLQDQGTISDRDRSTWFGIRGGHRSVPTPTKEHMFAHKQQLEGLVGSPSNATKAKRFAYYVTGHGFGHATRVVEVCRSLLHKGHSVIVCTSAPAFIFTSELPGVQVRHIERPLDVGGVQLDALSVDVEGTLCRYYETVHLRREELLEAEVAFLKEAGVDMVLVDSPALPCAAAKRASRPAVAITNLIWSHIYRDYLQHCLPEHRGRYGPMLAQISEDYGCATGLLKLPGSSPMAAFDHCKHILDMPLLVRRARTPPHDVRAKHGLPTEAKLVLITFGGQATDWRLQDEFLPPGWVGVVTLGPKETARKLPSRFVGVAQEEVYMPDLVNAVDAVIGKLGYGTVSEILAHDVPMIYVQRTHWNEQQYLLDLMHRHGAPIEMSMDDFNNGNWRPYLEAVCRGGNNRPRYDDGAADPAAVIVGALERVLHEVEAGRGEDKGEGGEEGGPSRDPLPHIGAHVATAAS